MPHCINLWFPLACGKYFVICFAELTKISFDFLPVGAALERTLHPRLSAPCVTDRGTCEEERLAARHQSWYASGRTLANNVSVGIWVFLFRGSCGVFGRSQVWSAAARTAATRTWAEQRVWRGRRRSAASRLSPCSPSPRGLSRSEPPSSGTDRRRTSGPSAAWCSPTPVVHASDSGKGSLPSRWNNRCSRLI